MRTHRHPLSQQNCVQLNKRGLLHPESHLIDPCELQNWVTVEVATGALKLEKHCQRGKCHPPPQIRLYGAFR
jgi:hypothetical protein